LDQLPETYQDNSLSNFNGKGGS